MIREARRCLSSSSRPDSTVRPSLMMVTESHRRSTSAMTWLDMSTVRPWPAAYRTASTNTSAWSGSSPEVGSSRITRSHGAASAATSMTFCRLPLELGADRFTRIQAEGLDEVGLARPVAPAAQGGEGIEGLRPRECGPQRHVTGNVGAPTRDPLGVVVRIHAQNPHHPAVAAVHAQKDADRRRLPRTVGAQETMDPPRLHLQVETVERPEGAEGLDQS